MTCQQREVTPEQDVPCSVSTLKAYLANERSKKQRTAQGGIGRIAIANARTNGDPTNGITSTTGRQPGVKGGITDDDI